MSGQQIEPTLFNRISILSPIFSIIDSSSASPNTMALSEPGPLRRLTDNYPRAYSDFAPHGPPCVYKTGPARPVRPSPRDSGFPWYHEARPVYNHPITAEWPRIGERIFKHLDFLLVLWSLINPLAYAHEGEAKPFCPLVISVGVTPESLPYHAAYAAAHDIKDILVEEGFPDVEVAMVESVVTRHSGTSSHFLPLTPSTFGPDVQNLVRPFTMLLGVPVALLEHPNLVGTGGLVFHLGKDSDDKPGTLGLLTCAHVALPTPIYGNQYKLGSALNEPSRQIEYITPGEEGYSDALSAISGIISEDRDCIGSWANFRESVQALLGADGEDTQLADDLAPTYLTRKLKQKAGQADTAQQRLNQLEPLHEVCENCAAPSRRLLGSLLYSAPLQVSSPDKFTSDWAMIAVHDVHKSTFAGNKIYLGDDLTQEQFNQLLYPHEMAQDVNTDKYPPDGLLQVAGIVGEAEVHSPTTLDQHGEPCLFVLKNGALSGTTVGRINGLDTFVRTFAGDDKITTREIAVVRHGFKSDRNAPFCVDGDSGAIVVTRDGRIVGLLNGSVTTLRDMSFVTPYWWLERQIKEMFPQSCLYEDVL